MHKIISLILLTPATLAQMDAVKPDIGFSGNNDRFDLTSMMRAHSNMNSDSPILDDGEKEASDAEYRRNVPNKGTETHRRKIPNEGETLIDEFQRKQAHNLFPIRRADDDAFAEDDRFNSYEGGSVSQFEENLKKFTVKRSSKSTVNDDEEATETTAVVLQNDASTVVDVTDVDVVVI